MKIETVLVLTVLPTLIRELGKSVNVSAITAFWESWGNRRRVALVPILAPPLATPTCVVDGRKMDLPARV